MGPNRRLDSVEEMISKLGEMKIVTLQSWAHMTKQWKHVQNFGDLWKNIKWSKICELESQRTEQKILFEGIMTKKIF